MKLLAGPPTVWINTSSGLVCVRPRTTAQVLHEQKTFPPADGAAVAGGFNSAAANGETMPTKDKLFPSKYLKPVDLKGQAVVLTIATAPVMTLKFRGKEEDKVVLHFKGTSKLLPLNVTNFCATADAVGKDNSDDWSGCKVEVYPDTAQLNGQTVPCVRIRKPGEKPAEPLPAPLAEPGLLVDDEIPF
jgi:hypothetical protein